MSVRDAIAALRARTKPMIHEAFGVPAVLRPNDGVKGQERWRQITVRRHYSNRAMAGVDGIVGDSMRNGVGITVERPLIILREEDFDISVPKWVISLGPLEFYELEKPSVQPGGFVEFRGARVGRPQIPRYDDVPEIM